MVLYSTESRLPKDKQYVLAHLTLDNWGDSDDPRGNRYWQVLQFVRGISKAERELLSVDDPKKYAYSMEDEGGNNPAPYAWKEFGPSSYTGEAVDKWCPLPGDN